MRITADFQLKFGYLHAGTVKIIYLGFLTLVFPSRRSRGITKVGVDLMVTDVDIMVENHVYLNFNLFDAVLGKSEYFFYPIEDVTLGYLPEVPCEVQMGTLDRNRPFMHRLKWSLHLPMDVGYRVTFPEGNMSPSYSNDLEGVKKEIEWAALIREITADLSE